MSISYGGKRPAFVVVVASNQIRYQVIYRVYEPTVAACENALRVSSVADRCLLPQLTGARDVRDVVQPETSRLWASSALWDTPLE